MDVFRVVMPNQSYRPVIIVLQDVIEAEIMFHRLNTPMNYVCHCAEEFGARADIIDGDYTAQMFESFAEVFPVERRPSDSYALPARPN